MAEGEELVESAQQDMLRVVAALAGILERVAERNDAAATPAELAAAPASPFRAMTKPGISVRAYVARIARFAGCSPACYVVAYIYLDRLLHHGRRFALAVDSYSVHRLLITTMLAAVKFMDDMRLRKFLSCLSFGGDGEGLGSPSWRQGGVPGAMRLGSPSRSPATTRSGGAVRRGVRVAEPEARRSHRRREIRVAEPKPGDDAERRRSAETRRSHRRREIRVVEPEPGDDAEQRRRAEARRNHREPPG